MVMYTDDLRCFYTGVTTKAPMDSSVPNIVGAALGSVFGIIFFAVCAIICTMIVGTMHFQWRS